jgi:hypothetical protein
MPWTSEIAIVCGQGIHAAPGSVAAIPVVVAMNRWRIKGLRHMRRNEFGTAKRWHGILRHLTSPRIAGAARTSLRIEAVIKGTPE